MTSIMIKSKDKKHQLEITKMMELINSIHLEKVKQYGSSQIMSLPFKEKKAIHNKKSTMVPLQ